MSRCEGEVKAWIEWDLTSFAARSWWLGKYRCRSAQRSPSLDWRGGGGGSPHARWRHLVCYVTCPVTSPRMWRHMPGGVTSYVTSHARRRHMPGGVTSYVTSHARRRHMPGGVTSYVTSHARRRHMPGGVTSYVTSHARRRHMPGGVTSYVTSHARRRHMPGGVTSYVTSHARRRHMPGGRRYHRWDMDRLSTFSEDKQLSYYQTYTGWAEKNVPNFKVALLSNCITEKAQIWIV